MPCPNCNGEEPRTTLAFAKPDDGGPCRVIEVEIKCRVCDGHGNATDEDRQRFEAGKQMRHERCKRGELIFDVANRMGITSAQLSAIERGHRPK